MDAELKEATLTDRSTVWSVVVPAVDARANSVLVELHCTSKAAALLLQTRINESVVATEVN